MLKSHFQLFLEYTFLEDQQEIICLRNKRTIKIIDSQKCRSMKIPSDLA